MSDASEKILIERIKQLKDELSQSDEAHAITTQRLGEANQKLDKANDFIGGYKKVAELYYQGDYVMGDKHLEALRALTPDTEVKDGE